MSLEKEIQYTSTEFSQVILKLILFYYFLRPIYFLCYLPFFTQSLTFKNKQTVYCYCFFKENPIVQRLK